MCVCSPRCKPIGLQRSGTEHSPAPTNQEERLPSRLQLAAERGTTLRSFLRKNRCQRTLQFLAIVGNRVLLKPRAFPDTTCLCTINTNVTPLVWFPAGRLGTQDDAGARRWTRSRKPGDGDDAVTRLSPVKATSVSLLDRTGILNHHSRPTATRCGISDDLWCSSTDCGRWISRDGADSHVRHLSSSIQFLTLWGPLGRCCCNCSHRAYCPATNIEKWDLFFCNKTLSRTSPRQHLYTADVRTEGLALLARGS